MSEVWKDAQNMKCKECGDEFIPNPQWHHSCGFCVKCKTINSRRIKARYKKSLKGKLSELRWRSNPIKQIIDKRYRQTKGAKRLAVIRARRCLKNNIHLQERKRKRDREFARTDAGREINRISTRKYRKTEKGKRIQKQYKYLLRNNYAGKIDWVAWEKKLKELGGKCQKCGTDINITIDHIIPLSKGGGNNIENLQPLCRKCNCRKQAKL